MVNPIVRPAFRAGNETQGSSVALTVHRLGIRSQFITVEDGHVRARLRYFIQLHEAITGLHKLHFEIRMNPDYPPIYIG